jgi:hypothetical protein
MMINDALTILRDAERRGFRPKRFEVPISLKHEITAKMHNGSLAVTEDGFTLFGVPLFFFRD